MRNYRLIFIITVVMIFNVVINGQDGIVETHPEKPLSGDSITVAFTSAGTVLEKADSVMMEVAVITFSNDDFQTHTESFLMYKEGNQWKSSIAISDSASLLGVKFVGAEGEVNNYKTGGLYIHLYNNKGEETLDSQIAYWRMILRPYYGTSKYFKREDYDSYNKELKPIDKLRDIFSDNPELARKYLYSAFGYTFFDLTKKSYAEEKLKVIAEYTNLSDKDYLALFLINTLWKDSLKLDDRVNAIKKEGINKYPKGILATRVYSDSLKSVSSIEDKLKVLNILKEMTNEDIYLRMAIYYVLEPMVKEKEYDMAFDLINNSLLPVLFTESFNQSLASKIVEELLKIETGKEFALVISKKAVDYELKNIAERKSENMFSDAPQKEREEDLNSALILYAKALIANNKKEGALEVYKDLFKTISFEDFNKNSIDALEQYVTMLKDEGEYNLIESVIKEAIKQGKDTIKMRDILKEIYITKHGSDAGFTDYVGKLQNGPGSRINELKEKMISTPAPDFTLMDLNGNEVKLSFFKGKVVVLDFWATWCGPCKASFPGMQQVVDKYAGDDEVELLFINTWEKGKNSKNNVEAFIADNGYKFHVLFDNDNEVVKSYGVRGIPAKFIIGKEGNIRFKESGFPGSTSDLVTDLSIMISMLK